MNKRNLYDWKCPVCEDINHIETYDDIDCDLNMQTGEFYCYTCKKWQKEKDE